MESKEQLTRWRLFFIRIILPSLLSISLFILTIFFIIIPRFKENILDDKREMIKELTNSASSILAKYENEERKGLISREEAQKTAISRIQYLRYGEENKDYFWITDMYPKMIMHPYRNDLDGTDLSDFKDPRGKKMFVEFVRVVKASGHGYVDYMWQWKDDSNQIVPKISYVKSFKPWNWIIGTGVYVEDVQKEIESLTGKLVKISISITAFITLLLIFITHQSLKIEQSRMKTEEKLKESRERYKTLVEAATEGLIMVIDGLISHSNKTIWKLTGFSNEDLINIKISDIVIEQNKKESLKVFNEGQIKEGRFEIAMKKKDGDTIDVLMIISTIDFQGSKANIIIVKDITINEDSSLKSIDYHKLINNLNFGFFRTTIELRGRFISANQATFQILGFKNMKELSEVYILDLFKDIEDRKNFRKKLIEEGFIRNKIMKMVKHNGENIVISVSLVVIYDENNLPLYCDGIIADITEQNLLNLQSEKLITEYQNSWLFLDQAVSNIMMPAVLANMNLPITNISKLISSQNVDYVILTQQENNAVGIITLEDLNNRLITQKIDDQIPSFEIMSSPLVYVASDCSLQNAIVKAQVNKVSHIVVKNKNEILGVLNAQILTDTFLKSSQYLTSSFENATIKELIELHKSLYVFIKPYIDSKINVSFISNKVTLFSDKITQRIIEIAISELGEPPAPFSFIVLGSEGRREQTLATDQDNAIIYENVKPEMADIANEYFLKLGKRVCTDLNEIGYAFCKGNVMAMNPLWCKPYSVWESYFASWLMTPDSKNLLDISIFFDFRTAYGEPSFTNNLRAFINRIIENKTAFFYNLIETSGSFKSTLTLSSNLSSDTKSSNDFFDLKSVIASIAMFARIYSLYYKIEVTNTISRIETLNNYQIFSNSLTEEILFGYNFLMQLRLKHQINRIQNQLEPDNYINYKSMTEVEQILLKKVMSQIAGYQTKINLDFKRATI